MLNSYTSFYRFSTICTMDSKLDTLSAFRPLNINGAYHQIQLTVPTYPATQYKTPHPYIYYQFQNSKYQTNNTKSSPALMERNWL